MKYSLILVGSHDGSKTESFVKERACRGNVLLVEPVPWLFEKLKTRYAEIKSIDLLNVAITEEDGEFTFYSPTDSANTIQDYGDQLGSLNPNHAKLHDERFSDKIEAIKVRGICFETLIKTFDIDAVEMLMTDTEGYDTRILSKFPFLYLKPEKILFEHKHSDGVYNVGRNLSQLLVILETFGYKMTIIDAENTMAVLEKRHPLSRGVCAVDLQPKRQGIDPKRLHYFDDVMACSVR
jgi:FkbM family methyltransferase